MARLASALCVLALFAPAFAQEAPSRTWTSSDGAFKVEAEFVSATSENVVIKRKGDGKELTVALSKLSAADQKWITDNATKAVGKEEEAEVPKVNKSWTLAVDVKKPEITVTAQQLANEYSANVEKANGKYSSAATGKFTGPPVRVDGIVDKVYENEKGIPCIELKTTGKMKVVCFVPAWWSEFALSRKPGNRVAFVSEHVSDGSAPNTVVVQSAECVKVK